MKITKWNIEPANSEARFRVRKLMITNVTGNLEVFEGQAETETEDFEFIKRICFKAAVNSIKTDDAKRNAHLKSADFFDMEKYPSLLFVAGDFLASQKKIQADLTIKNITRTVVLNVDFGEATVNKEGSEMVELSVYGKINRREFGLVWDGKNKAGDIIVGDEIQLKAEIQFVKQTQNATGKALKECVL